MGTDARTYTPEQKSEALARYVEYGPAEASRRCGIPAATIRSWAKREGKSSPRADRALAGAEAARLTWRQRKSEIAMRSGDAAAEFIERAIGTDNARKGSDWMRAFREAVQAAQLLDGGATGRVELSESEVRAGVQKIRDDLKARRERKQAAAG